MTAVGVVLIVVAGAMIYAGITGQDVLAELRGALRRTPKQRYVRKGG